MNDDLDPILDASLEEVLGGSQPPDLTDQIMSRHQQESADLALVVRSHPVDSPLKLRRSRSNPLWTAIGVTAAILLGALGIGYLMQSGSFPTPNTDPITPPVAERRQPSPSQPLDDLEKALERRLEPEPSQIVEDRIDMPLPELPDFGVGPWERSTKGESGGPTIRLTADQIVLALDNHMREVWLAHDIRPSESMDDNAWAVTAFERFLGRAPTANEIAEFTALGSNRRGQLIDQLLQEPAYRTRFAQQWTQLLLGRERAQREESEAFVDALAEAFENNDSSFTAVMERIIGDESTSTLAEPFYLAHFDSAGHQVTAHAGRLLLGDSVGCARCHDHPSEESWTQQAYWEWNAFIRALAPTTGRASAIRLSRNAVFYELDNGELKAAFPSLPGDTVDHQAVSVDRQTRLAERLLHSHTFAEAAVNQFWKMLFHYGLRATDGSRIDEDGPHEDLLRLLSEQFAAHEYQVDELLRWIALSEPFALQGTGAAIGAADAPDSGGVPLFSRRYEPPRQFPVEELLAGLGRATEIGSATTTARLAPPLGASGDLEIVADGPGNLTLDPRYGRAFYQDPPAVIQAIVESDMNREWKVRHVFLAVVHREPERQELRQLLSLLASHRDEPQLLFDLWFALLQSAE